MRTTTLLFVLVAAVASGCSKKAKTTPTPPDTTPTPTAQKPAEKPREVSADTLMSPGIAVSADIAAACGLKPQQTKAGTAPTFDTDKDELLPEDRAVLDQVATCLTTGALKGKQVELVGRADPRGTEEYNMGLGSRRSNTVSQYLGRLGVGQPQMQATSRGALEATGTDEEGWKKDRRVDILLAQPKG